MRKIVLPGELLSAEPKRTGDHAFARNGKVYSDVLGIAHEDNNTAFVVPLTGKYIPKTNDLIVCIVAQTVHNGYLVDINGFYLAFVSKLEIRDLLKPGSILSAKVMGVSETHDVELGQVRVFYGGELFSVSPVKVPRIIGKNGSMLQVLKSGTLSNIMVGRNGRVWAKGGNISLLRTSIQKIEDEAHLENLTDSMSSFLKVTGTEPVHSIDASTGGLL